ncbi:MAG: Na(+)/H(+) antiporter subunit B [bacterium]
MIRHFEDIIVQTVSRILVPFMQIYALYVIAHGHHSPGGGFQGGCILGASFILLCTAYDIHEAKKRMTEKMNLILCCTGVLIYSGIGVICLILGGNYLNYSQLHKVLPVDPVMARSHGMLGIEIGVGLTVMAVMVSIFYDLASIGKHEEALE